MVYGGVPQGTVSGPIDFILYINDLVTLVPMYKYVDDTTIFEVCLENEPSAIQDSVDVIVRWTDLNDMWLNSDKCKEMVIDCNINHQRTSGAPTIIIGERALERVDHAKLLGVTISNDLTWGKHVENIISKAGKRLYMLYQLKRAGISQNGMVKIYISVVRPVLEYACPVWSTSLPKYLSDAIEMIQKRALRAIYPGLHYDDMLTLLGLKSLKDRRDALCKTYFKRLLGNNHRLNQLIPAQRVVPYELRDTNVYPITLTRTGRYKHSLIPWGLRHWQ